MELSVVVPVYRSVKNSIRHIPSVISLLNGKFSSFEILFIIDHDNTAEQENSLSTLQDLYTQVKVIPLNKNYGQHFATLTGYSLAQGDHIVSVDEDMVKYIPEICTTEEYKSFDVFYWMYDKNQMYTSGFRKLFSILFKFFLEKIVVFHKNSTFRCINRKLRNQLLTGKHLFWNLDIMIFRRTSKIGRAAMNGFDVKDEESGYNYLKLLRVAFEITYEHNTLFMNSVFSLLPAFLVYYASENTGMSLFFYLLSIIASTLFVLYLRNKTISTTEKINDALNSPVRKPVFE